jgi:hypothetical protein
MLWKRLKNTVYSKEYIFRQKESCRAIPGAEADMIRCREQGVYNHTYSETGPF